MTKIVNQQVAGFLRWHDHLLLVAQPGAPGWYLPCGEPRPGETLDLALQRVVQQTAGLSVPEPGPLVCVVRLVDMATRDEHMTYLFDVGQWPGTPHGPARPGSSRTAAEFMPLAEATAELAAQPRPTRREPLLAYLQGDVGPGYVWLYQNDAGQELFITRMFSGSVK